MHHVEDAEDEAHSASTENIADQANHRAPQCRSDWQGRLCWEGFALLWEIGPHADILVPRVVVVMVVLGGSVLKCCAESRAQLLHPVAKSTKEG